MIDIWDLEFDRKPVAAVSSRGTPFTRWVSYEMPRIPDRLLNCVFYLYHSEEDAIAGRNAGGTGFVVALKSTVDPTKHFIFAVTNWHVACQSGASVVRVMRRDGQPEVFAYGPEDWFFDPQGHDVAIVPLPLQSKVHDCTYLPISNLRRLDGEPTTMGIGDDVFMIGRFVDHDGGEKNKPTVRFGNISMMPTPIQMPNGNKLDAYCLDMHSRSGYSGSPVFVYRLPGGDLNERLKTGKDAELLFAGASILTLLGIHVGQFPEIWRIKSVKTAAPPAEAVELTATEQHIEGVSGMTCVAPISAVLALLEAPALKKRIEDAEKELIPPAAVAAP